MRLYEVNHTVPTLIIKKVKINLEIHKLLIKLNTIRWQIGNVDRHHLDTLTNGAVKNMTLPIMMVQRQIGLSAQMIFCFSSKTLQSWNLNQPVTQHVSGWFSQSLWFITFFTSFMSIVLVPNLIVILHKY